MKSRVFYNEHLVSHRKPNDDSVEALAKPIEQIINRFRQLNDNKDLYVTYLL